MFWEPACDPSVIIADASPAQTSGEGVFDLRMLRVRASVLRGMGPTEQVLLGHGPHSIRLSIDSGTLLLGPVRLRFELPGHANLETRLSALRRLAHIRAGADLSVARDCHPRRAARPELILRTLDAMAAEASLRGIAIALFGAVRVAEDWDRPSDYLKSRVRRLVAQARALAAGGYLNLLKH